MIVVHLQTNTDVCESTQVSTVIKSEPTAVDALPITQTNGTAVDDLNIPGVSDAADVTLAGDETVILLSTDSIYEVATDRDNSQPKADHVSVTGDSTMDYSADCDSSNDSESVSLSETTLSYWKRSQSRDLSLPVDDTSTQTSFTDNVSLSPVIRDVPRLLSSSRRRSTADQLTDNGIDATAIRSLDNVNLVTTDCQSPIGVTVV